MKTARIFCDGAGQRPDGSGSGFAWVREDNGEKHIEQKDYLTNNQAEYLAILSALEHVKSGSAVEIITDSNVVACQLRGSYRVNEPELVKLHDKIQKLVRTRRLKTQFVWVSRAQNKAGRLLE